ncbi:hypothetical protein ACFO3J_24775 [Streptomyces polygonati]|uniref:Uncharacterized protein n=1 Tax=Streptomyces polygonati TaxID=1617087 RepID=A0ABV8HU57_9ACTN
MTAEPVPFEHDTHHGGGRRHQRPRPGRQHPWDQHHISMKRRTA